MSIENPVIESVTHSKIPLKKTLGVLLVLELIFGQPRWETVWAVPVNMIVMAGSGALFIGIALIVVMMLTKVSTAAQVADIHLMGAGILAVTLVLYFKGYQQRQFESDLINCVKQKEWKQGGEEDPTNPAKWCIEYHNYKYSDWRFPQ